MKKVYIIFVTGFYNTGLVDVRSDREDALAFVEMKNEGKVCTGEHEWHHMEEHNVKPKSKVK